MSNSIDLELISDDLHSEVVNLFESLGDLRAALLANAEVRKEVRESAVWASENEAAKALQRAILMLKHQRVWFERSAKRREELNKIYEQKNGTENE